jgi:hypothetical protein
MRKQKKSGPTGMDKQRTMLLQVADPRAAHESSPRPSIMRAIRLIHLLLMVGPVR